jgi:hypothetical protein
MANKYSLQGNAVELSVMWVLRRKQAGETVTAERAYEEIARPFLNRAWKESKDKVWQVNPKKHCCLREHYYSRFSTEPEKEWTRAIAQNTKLCIANFIDSVLPTLQGVRPGQELDVATVDRGDPESFTYSDVKIYAIPDYVYKDGDELHIYDWKSGKPREKHKDQLALYGLWAHTKHAVDPASIKVHIEYLLPGTSVSMFLEKAALTGVEARIVESVQDMAEYLVDGDVRKNTPLPKEDWDLAPNLGPCRMCNFYELCEPELSA